jgi:hypothetical protein
MARRFGNLCVAGTYIAQRPGIAEPTGHEMDATIPHGLLQCRESTAAGWRTSKQGRSATGWSPTSGESSSWLQERVTGPGRRHYTEQYSGIHRTAALT